MWPAGARATQSRHHRTRWVQNYCTIFSRLFSPLNRVRAKTRKVRSRITRDACTLILTEDGLNNRLNLQEWLCICDHVQFVRNWFLCIDCTEGSLQHTISRSSHTAAIHCIGSVALYALLPYFRWERDTWRGVGRHVSCVYWVAFPHFSGRPAVASWLRESKGLVQQGYRTASLKC
jgi:hypothetical protein